jgi:hypothetical protein
MPKMPPGTRAEQVAWAKEELRRQERARNKVRFSRTTRRFIVAALWVVVAATVLQVAALASNTVSGGKAVGILYFMLAVETVVYAGLWFSVGDMTKGDSILDERERAVRDHATSIAYRILAILIAIGSLVAISGNVIFHLTLPERPGMGAAQYLLPFVWLVIIGE